MSIKDTALAAVGGRVPRGMGARAQAAVDALEAREQAMFEEIVEAGVELGATRDTVHDILVEAGMTPPEDDCAEAVDEAVGGLAARVAALEARVDDAIARGQRALRRR